MSVITYLLTRADLLLYFSTFIALVIYWINGSKKSTVKMPPGPKPFPFIGNIHLLDLNKPHRSLMELSEKYGEVYTLELGGKKTVVIAGYQAVKDALVNQADDFGERADVPLFNLITKQRGIIMNTGESWKAMRRFTLSTLRDFGMGKKTVEARIQDELIPLIKKIKSFQGKPLDTNIIINSAVSNVICSIIFGRRFEYDDPVFLKLVQMENENGKLSGSPMAVMSNKANFSPQLYNYYPRIGYLIGAHKKFVQNIDEFLKFIAKQISHHQQEYDPNNIVGYIDAYLMKQQQESSKTETYFDDKNLVFTVMDLFDAGTETTSTALRWAILLMMKYPEIQKKVQEEIQEHIRPGQMPSVEDRKNMPYTEAVVHEIQRFANILPLSVMHTCPRDVYFRGYCIPKGTDVIPLLGSVLYDKTQWKTPYEFNPNNFLDDAGKFVRNDAFMPFSAGKRICAGEGLAKMEMFLFFTGLLQTFTFYPPPGVSREDLSLESDIGFILLPKPHLVCAKLN
ncbi:cytochrome P450 2K4-like [Gastrophryne carolinensis]